ncbi:hypothetical protein MITSMUL_04199 [Mitsuokella multacida DSM 20544]|uniref:Uncharacterized protein n=1 Tax=Mitsuokella multacida DSM 20544 TaxID=500635 RepID=C9KLW5_9FIRM|nr:hypothetical protein MITSMUL_04199 [Mitsuokella multacida DSM 20544]
MRSALGCSVSQYTGCSRCSGCSVNESSIEKAIPSSKIARG